MRPVRVLRPSKTLFEMPMARRRLWMISPRPDARLLHGRQAAAQAASSNASCLKCLPSGRLRPASARDRGLECAADTAPAHRRLFAHHLSSERLQQNLAPPVPQLLVSNSNLPDRMVHIGHADE
jgi:hypothetical protein